MQLDALVRFAVVVEAGSFSAAARQLGISRQAVQRSIDQLETAHKVQLLERSTRSLRLTDAGRRLLAVARDVRASSQEAAALLRAEAEAPRGRLRLSAPPLFARFRLAEVIADFLARWPDVQIEATPSTAQDTPSADGLDLLIRLGAPPAQTHARRLGAARRVLVASPQWRAEAGPLPRPEALLSVPVLVYGTPAPLHLQAGAESVTLDVSPRLQASNAEVVLRAALRHLGVLCIPEMAVRSHLSEGSLVKVLPDWTLPDTPIWAVYSPRAAFNPTLSAFLDALGAALMGISARAGPAPRAPAGSTHDHPHPPPASAGPAAP